MPVCPSCQAEYEASMTRCKECDTALVDKLETNVVSEDTTDVYACYEPQLAVRLTEILNEEGVEVLVRDRSSNLFPTNLGKTAQRVIAVATHDVGRARAAIESAIADGVVPADGEMIER